MSGPKNTGTKKKKRKANQGSSGADGGAEGCCCSLERRSIPIEPEFQEMIELFVRVMGRKEQTKFFDPKDFEPDRREKR